MNSLSHEAFGTHDSRIRVVCAVPHSYDLSPGQRYRWEQWQPGLRENGVDLSFLPFCTPKLDSLLRKRKMVDAGWEALKRYPSWLSQMHRARDADLLIIPRKAAPAGSMIVERWAARRAHGFVYDFDDAIFLQAPGRSDLVEFLLRTTTRCAALSREANLVTTGNDYLAEYARKHSTHVHVIPTTVDTDIHRPRSVPKSTDSPVVVGWSGSRTTAIYLEEILPLIRELQTRVNFELLVVGAQIDLGGARGRAVPWTSATEVSLLQEMDVGLMPLENTEWEKGKCSLKALLYGAVGIPSIVSNVGTNPEAVRDEVTGFVVNTDKEWLERMERLIRDQALRRTMGAAARAHIVDRYSSRRWVPVLAEALHAAARRRSGPS